MSKRILLVLVAGMAVPLLYLYFSFLGWFISNPSLFPSNPLETLILTTQVLRLIVIMSLRRLRRAELPVIIIIGSIEMLIVPFLALIYLIINDPAYISIVGGIYAAWPAAILLVFPVYGVYRLAATMHDDAKLSTVLPSATGTLAVLAFLISLTTQLPPAPGLAGLSRSIVSSFSSASAPGIASPELGVSVVLLYVVLIIYATTQGRGIPSTWNLALLLSVIGTLTAIGWGSLATYLTGSALAIFGVPALILLAIMWLIVRAH